MPRAAKIRAAANKIADIEESAELASRVPSTVEFGDPIMPYRWWSKIDVVGECWVWASAVGGSKYGRYYYEGKAQSAHRVSYSVLVGPIAKGMSVDHLCRVRGCVNPSHLEAVTPKENRRRGTRSHIATLATRRSHCVNGHEYTESNTYARGLKRWCKACRRAGNRASKRRAARAKARADKG